MYDGKQERAEDNPIRVAILGLLSDGRELPATAIVHELPDAPALSVVAYHVRVLLDAKLVKMNGDRAAPVYSLA